MTNDPTIMNGPLYTGAADPSGRAMVAGIANPDAAARQALLAAGSLPAAADPGVQAAAKPVGDSAI